MILTEDNRMVSSDNHGEASGGSIYTPEDDEKKVPAGIEDEPESIGSDSENTGDSVKKVRKNLFCK